MLPFTSQWGYIMVMQKPDWLKISLETNAGFTGIKRQMRAGNLHTVCEEARCPNIHECWGQHKTATFMILGDTCTRRCRFCSVKTGLPGQLDVTEPRKVAQAVKEMQLKHVVITMVNRDDLNDGGSRIMCNTVLAVKKLSPHTSVEVLASDMMGKTESIAVLMESGAEIMSHNLETVRRLTPLVRSRSTYERSLDFLRIAGELDRTAVIKSSLMVGLGESSEELEEAMDDLLANNVKMMNIGQYLQPTKAQLPVQKYYHPDEFAALRETALAKGFLQVHSGPLVRSSYHAGENYSEYRKQIHPLARDPELSAYV